MTPVSLLLGLAIAVTALAGCSEQDDRLPAAKSSPEDPTRTPAEVVLSYIDALFHNRVEEAYGYLAGIDREVENPEKFEQSMVLERAFLVSYAECSSLIDLLANRVEEAVEYGDSAKVTVLSTLPDMQRIHNELGEFELFLAIRKGRCNARLRRQYGEGIPTSDYPRHYDLVKEPGGWKVRLQRGSPARSRADLKALKRRLKEPD